jgi:hypothetical protein
MLAAPTSALAPGFLDVGKLPEVANGGA